MTERTFMDKFHDFRYTTFGRIALFGLFMSPVFIAQAYSHFTTPDLDKNRKELANIVNEHRGHGCMAPDLFLKSQIDKYEDLEKEMYGLKTEIKDLLEVFLGCHLLKILITTMLFPSIVPTLGSF